MLKGQDANAANSKHPGKATNHGSHNEKKEQRVAGLHDGNYFKGPKLYKSGFKKRKDSFPRNFPSHFVFNRY